MASLISKASLLMVPSVYEDGTLYNVLPSGNKAPDETGNHNGYDQTRADFTFSRGFNLTATRVNASGLIEKGRENTLEHSNNFNDASYTKVKTSFTSGQPDKDGGTNAWKYQCSSNGASYFYKTPSTNSGIRTRSIYAKAGTASQITFLWDSFNQNEHATFDLANGTFTNAGCLADMESVGNGWYRCITTITDSANTYAFLIGLADKNGSASTAGDNVYLMFGQQEAGLVATDYIETGATTATAGVLENTPRIDYSSGAGALLLESSRTNLIEHSEYLPGWSNFGAPPTTISQTLAPDGTYTAYDITDNDTGSYDRLISNSVSFSTGTYTASIFVKKTTGTPAHYPGFQILSSGGYVSLNTTTGATSQISGNDHYNIEAVSFNDDWWRLTFSRDVTAVSDTGIRIWPAISDDGINLRTYAQGTTTFWGAQLEAGSHVSSYVPTYGSAATRGADSCSVTGASDVIDSTQGTIYFEGYSSSSSVTNYSYFISLSDGTQNNRLELRQSGDEIQFLWRVGGVYQNNIITSGASITDKWKAAVKYSSSEISFYLNGSEVGSISSPTLYSANTLNRFGFDDGAGSNKLQGKNEQLVYFNEALSDSELATLTTL